MSTKENDDNFNQQIYRILSRIIVATMLIMIVIKSCKPMPRIKKLQRPLQSQDKFNHWTVLSLDPGCSINPESSNARWICRCRCGIEKSVLAKTLLNGDSKSCGCWNRERVRSRIPKIAGQKFGRWTAIELTAKQGSDQSCYLCKCDCGNEKIVPTRNLLNGDSRSCGCLHSDVCKQNRVVDLTGVTLGRWTVIKRAESIKSNPGSRWHCRCECGTEKVVDSYSLRSGLSASCGCLHKEKVAEIGKKKRSHGETGTRLYNVWAGIKSRCNDPKQPAYKNYGGRGISVCFEWDSSYEAFRDWALKNGYQDSLTIERKDVNGDYCPENCAFISLAEQARNKRNIMKVTAWGETKPVFEWIFDPRCKIKSLSSLKTRLARGMQPEKAIATPIMRAKIGSS